MNTKEFLALTQDERVAHIDRQYQEWLAEIGKTPEDLVKDYEKAVANLLPNNN